MRSHTLLYFLLTACLCFVLSGQALAQSFLSRTVSIDVTNTKLKEVLNQIGRQGNFSFSYNSNIIKRDSLVTIKQKDKTVKQVLDILFNEKYQYKETDNHIIILTNTEKWFYISGYITDVYTGGRINDASVFETNQLTSSLSNSEGYFRLRLREHDKKTLLEIRVSRGFYHDTSIWLQPVERELNIAIRPADHALNEVEITQYSQWEESWLGKALFSKQLRKQSANLGKFFTEKPFQVSLLPGLGSHGKMSGQVTNRFSFNALGGYAAGVDGLEIGGLFNIDKKNVKYVQIAGFFNKVSGSVEGVQIAGLVNMNEDSLKGVQISGITSRNGGNAKGVVISGISNRTNGKIKGVQLSGIVNRIYNSDTIQHKDTTTPYAMNGLQLAGINNLVIGNVQGMQLAGITNRATGSVKGMQMAGIVNRSLSGTMEGMQLSGILNVARKVKGVQFGLVNIADTVDGYSIGLFCFARKGYHAISYSSTEFLDHVITYKSGNRQLHSILTIGFNTTKGNSVFMYGYGIGTEAKLSKKLSLSIDLSEQNLEMGDTTKTPFLFRLEPTLEYHVTKWLTFFAGPAASFCPDVKVQAGDNYLKTPYSNRWYTHQPFDNAYFWLGWKYGIRIF